MYRILKDGTPLATVTTPVWVKMQNNGCYGLCTEEQAHGIVIEGSVYHIEGRSELEGKETVSVTTISEVAYQKKQEAILKGKAEQADVDAIAAAIERGLSL